LKLQADGRRLLTGRRDLKRRKVRLMVDVRKARSVRLPICKLYDDAACSFREQVSTRQDQPALAIRLNLNERSAADVHRTVREVVVDAARRALSTGIWPGGDRHSDGRPGEASHGRHEQFP
jgi:hypothetical protein